MTKDIDMCLGPGWPPVATAERTQNEDVCGQDHTPYRIPFSIDRSTPPWFRLVHIGDESVRGVTLFELDAVDGVVASTAPCRLLPGQAMPFSVRSQNPARGTVVIVRWFRPSGAEYVWRVSF